MDNQSSVFLWYFEINTHTPEWFLLIYPRPTCNSYGCSSIGLKSTKDLSEQFQIVPVDYPSQGVHLLFTNLFNLDFFLLFHSTVIGRTLPNQVGLLSSDFRKWNQHFGSSHLWKFDSQTLHFDTVNSFKFEPQLLVVVFVQYWDHSSKQKGRFFDPIRPLWKIFDVSDSTKLSVFPVAPHFREVELQCFLVHLIYSELLNTVSYVLLEYLT